MADADDVRRLALALPGVEEIDSDGFDFRVGGKGFVWSYPERRPGKPRVIRTDIAVLFVGDEAEKQALLLGEPGTFFTAPGYDGWPLVMLRLAEVDVERLAELVTDAWRMRAPEELARMTFVDTVAWVRLENGRILCARPRGKDVFYVPGGKREAAESDLQTLLREITEELAVTLLPETVTHVGTYEADQPDGAVVRMSCYAGDYTGTLAASSEIDELDWFSYADRPRVPPVDQLLFDDLKAPATCDDAWRADAQPRPVRGPPSPPGCASSQAVALAGEARESQASWMTSASSCTVSSPIRLPRSSTDGGRQSAGW